MGAHLSVGSLFREESFQHEALKGALWGGKELGRAISVQAVDLEVIVLQDLQTDIDINTQKGTL